jgi:hypothetical protein
VTLKDIKDVKSHMFNKLKDKKGTREYEEWFLNYNPIEKYKTKERKGKDAKVFDEKIKDVNKFSPSYSKHRDNDRTKTRTRARTIAATRTRTRTRARTKTMRTRTHRRRS